MDIGVVLGGFWNNFGMVLEGFWLDLQILKSPRAPQSQQVQTRMDVRLRLRPGYVLHAPSAQRGVSVLVLFVFVLWTVSSYRPPPPLSRIIQGMCGFPGLLFLLCFFSAANLRGLWGAT